MDVAYGCLTWYIYTYFEEHTLKKVAIADLEAYNPALTSIINAWQADALAMKSSLLHFDVSVWNSGIYKETIYIYMKISQTSYILIVDQKKQ